MDGLGRKIVSLAAAKVLTLFGLFAFVSGLFLMAIGIPAAWLAWSGALLSGISFAASYLLARSAQPDLNRRAQEGLTTIYMPLLNEGVDVWRPVEAMKITDLGYMVTENARIGEEWAFQPGHILQCEERQLSEGRHLVAVSKAT
jgi:hypothetical protein